MKTLLLVLSISVLSLQVHASDIAVHGMFVFGKNPIYLNHLSMFMAPHDEQAIFEATLDDGGAYAQVSSGLVTLVPEPMSLEKLITQPHDFFADLYDGHFERGGHKIATHIRVHIVRVVHAHAIGAAKPAPDIVFGDCHAHYITRAPDYDEISCGGVKIYREDQDLQ